MDTKLQLKLSRQNKYFTRLCKKRKIYKVMFYYEYLCILERKFCCNFVSDFIEKT